jgi:hypothetical protein
MKQRVIASIAIAALVLLSACGGTESGGLSGASPTARPTGTGLTLGSPSATVGAATSTPRGTASATTSPAGTGATGSPAATGTGTAGTASSSDVCGLATRDDVEKVIGTLAAEPTRVDLPMPGFIASACVYASDDGALTIAMAPRGLGRAEFETGMRLVPGATSLSGVGDIAFSVRSDVPSGAAGAASIAAHKGSTFFSVQATSRTKSSDTLLAGITELAKEIAGEL